jgi:hypothetical protein
MKMDIWEKDLDIVGNHIDQVCVKALLFAAAKERYQKWLLDGLATEVTAPACQVREDIAGFKWEPCT